MVTFSVRSLKPFSALLKLHVVLGNDKFHYERLWGWEGANTARREAVREAVWLWLASDVMLVTGIGNPSRHLLGKQIHKALQCSASISLNGGCGLGLLNVWEGRVEG